jgi:general stress protein 26
MATSDANNPYERSDLPTVLRRLWQHLQHGAASSKSGFHLPTLSTVDRQGTPDARVVVLRRVEPAERVLICHTDRRSPKVADLLHHPAAAWTFYDAPAKVQLRVQGRVTVHTDDALADAQWAASTLSSRRCYLAPEPPGAETKSPSPNLPEAVRNQVPTEAEADPGRANFAVLRTVAERFDWLYLHHAGHRRAAFCWGAESSEPAMRWLEV